MKRLLFILSLLVVVTVLQACEPPSDIIINDREEFFEEGATTINMWAADFEEWQNQLNIQQRMDFNDIKDDGIQLAQTFIQQSDIDDRLRSARETNSMPDIYMISLGNLYKEINRGNAADISSYINTWDDLVDNASEAVTFGGKKYGYPICIEPSSLVFYRKDLLQQYGNTTEIPAKWDDFLALCGTIKKNIKAAGVKGVYAFDVPKGVACAWATVGMQASVTGGLAITDDWSESRLMGDGKEGYLALGNIWAELYGNGYIPLASGAYNEYITPLCLGNQVMTTAGSWSISEVVNSYPEMVDKIGVAVMPTLDGNQDVTTATNGGWAYVISTDCKNKEKAAEVIKFLVAGEDTSKTEEYFQKAYYSKSSPRKSVQAKIEASLANQTEVPAEWVEVVNEVAEKAVLEPIFSWDISVAIELYLEECAMGEDPLTKLKAADQAVKNLIKNDNLAGNNPRG